MTCASTPWRRGGGRVTRACLSTLLTWLGVALLQLPASAQIMSGLRNQPGPRDIPTMPLDTNVSSDLRPTFRTAITRVEVSALVVDEAGEPVRGLTAADFEVFDGKRPQSITSFTAFGYNGSLIPLDDRDDSSDDAATAALVTNAWSSSSRLIALLIDDLHIDARRTGRARVAARRLVTQLAPSDLLYVGLTSTPTLSTGAFTRDRRRALELIDSFAGMRLPDPTIELLHAPGQVTPNRQLEGTRMPGLAASEQQRAMQLEQAYGSLGRVAHAVRDISGRRKTLVFLSEGSPVGASVTSSGSLSGNTTGAMLDALAAASVADLAVYPINPAGLDLPGEGLIEGHVRSVDLGNRDVAQDDLSNVLMQYLQAKNQLRDLAALTGGVSLIDTNDLGAAVDRVLRDASDYYVLSYEPDREMKGKTMRPIEVRVRRPGVRVFTRKGYMAPSGRLAVKTRTAAGVSPALTTLLGGTVGVDGLPMVVQAIAIGEHNGKTRVALVTETAGGPLIDGLDDGQIELDQAVLSIDGRGKTSNATQKRAVLQVTPEQTTAIGRQGLRAIWVIELAPGHHQVRVATVDPRSGRGGSLFLEMDIASGAIPHTAALTALLRSPMPTAFVDPQARKAIDGDK